MKYIPKGKSTGLLKQIISYSEVPEENLSSPKDLIRIEIRQLKDLEDDLVDLKTTVKHLMNVVSDINSVLTKTQIKKLKMNDTMNIINKYLQEETFSDEKLERILNEEKEIDELVQKKYKK